MISKTLPPIPPMCCCSISAAWCSISIFNKALNSGAGQCRLRPPPTSRLRFVPRRILQTSEVGKIDDAAYFESLRATLAFGFPMPMFLEVVERDLRRRKCQASRHSVKRASGQLPLYAFSNTNRPHVEYFTKKLFRRAGAIFAKCSCHRASGFGTPDAAAYDHVGEKRSVCPPRASYSSTISRRKHWGCAGAGP